MTTHLVGRRCRIISLARDNITGVPLRSRTGTIRSQIDNIGRTLLLVRWDAVAEASFVLPSDIEILDAEERPEGAS